MSALILATSSLGVPPGAKMPYQGVMTKLGTPASTIVGRSG
jgi:hypothetical protein